MNQSLLASAAEQRTQVDLNFLQTELSQLYQTSEQSNKQQLNHDLIT